MKYKKLTGVILKKQNYREADQIISLWTKETGKIRIMAKSLRLAKSKLAYNLSDLTLVEVEVVGRNSLPTVISCTCKNNYKNLREDLIKMGSAFYASELMLKMTADEQSNDQAFGLLTEFLQKLNDLESVEHYELLDNFALGLSSVLGFGTPKKVESHSDVKNFIEELIERNIKSEAFLTSQLLTNN